MIRLPVAPSFAARCATRGIVGIAVAATIAALGAIPAYAAPFTISGSSTTGQTLGAASGETGTVTATGSLVVAGSTNAVSITGNNATLNNLGTIRQTGTGRALRLNAAVSGLTINNGSLGNSSALMQTADADVVQVAVAGGGVTLYNYGAMVSLNASAGGAQAVDFAAVTTAANAVYNYFGGLMQASEADAVRPGVIGTVYNAGMIVATTSTGSSSDAIDVQANSGVQVTNDATGLVQGGRHGVTGGAASNSVVFTTAVTNNFGGLISGQNGSGINLDGFNALQTATLTNHGTITGNGVTGDGDGVDVDGVVNITNTGTIRSINAFSSTTPAASEGITAGGGSIVNSGTIEGLVTAGNLNAVGRGITLAGVDITSGPLSGTREAIYANSAITNQAGGLIRGQSDSAIVVEGPASGFTVTINNNAGATLRGGGASNAAVRTGADNDTLINAGMIDGSSSGRAVDLGAGNNTMAITGGNATVLGDINGGVGGVNAMTINPGTGNAFAYAGSISNFSTVDVQGGTVTLSGVSTYSGATIVSGGTLQIDGANRLASGTALNLDGGTLQLMNSGGANGQTFSSLWLADSSAIDLGGSSLSFNALASVGTGVSLSVLNFLAAVSPDYALRFLGDYSDNAAFLALLGGTTINGLAAGFDFDGFYTNVRPVPIPAALWLLLSGLGALFGVGRRGRGSMALRGLCRVA